MACASFCRLFTCCSAEQDDENEKATNENDFNEVRENAVVFVAPKGGACEDVEVKLGQAGLPVEDALTPLIVPQQVVCANNGPRPLKKGRFTAFPTTIEQFGYEFDDLGTLRDKITRSNFAFQVDPNDQGYNQRHYDALGEAITEHVYGLLENKCLLKRVATPLNKRTEEEASGFFFVSEDALSNDGTMLILVHGSGVVRAGQWARRLIINDTISSGTQLPFILRAREKGWAVVVLNGNQRSETGEPIRENENSSAHAAHVWRHFIRQTSARRICIVAHSAGGYDVGRTASLEESDFIRRVAAVAFTDSFCPSDFTASWCQHLRQVAVNWVTSAETVDKNLSSSRGGILQRSSGTTKHEETSYNAVEAIFNFFDEKLSEV